MLLVKLRIKHFVCLAPCGYGNSTISNIIQLYAYFITIMFPVTLLIKRFLFFRLAPCGYGNSTISNILVQLSQFMSLIYHPLYCNLEYTTISKYLL